MSEVNKLGSLTVEYPIEIGGESAVLFIRGLTVAEYMDLSMKGLLRLSSRLFMKIAYTGIIGWDGISVEDESGERTQDFETEYLDSLPEDLLLDIGRHIYYNLTEVDEEIEEKMRGYIRFLFWASEDDHKQYVKNYDCETCLEKGLAKKKKCGKFTEKEIDYQYKVLNGKDISKEKKGKSTKEKVSKYSSKSRKTFSTKAEYEDKNDYSAKDYVLLVNCTYKYPECPVSWVDGWIKDISSALYHCEKSGIPFFDGGLADQPYRFYRASKVVTGEANQIEHEKMEKARNDN